MLIGAVDIMIVAVSLNERHFPHLHDFFGSEVSVPGEFEGTYFDMVERLYEISC